MSILYQGEDHRQRKWLVYVDNSRPKDPTGTIRVWFTCTNVNPARGAHVDCGALWHPRLAAWQGTWRPTNPRSVPVAVRQFVEAALQRQGVA